MYLTQIGVKRKIPPMKSRVIKGSAVTVGAILGLLFLIVLWGYRAKEIIGWFR
jgi:hypothetical protein